MYADAGVKLKTLYDSNLINISAENNTLYQNLQTIQKGCVKLCVTVTCCDWAKSYDDKKRDEDHQAQTRKGLITNATRKEDQTNSNPTQNKFVYESTKKRKLDRIYESFDNAAAKVCTKLDATHMPTEGPPQAELSAKSNREIQILESEEADLHRQLLANLKKQDIVKEKRSKTPTRHKPLALAMFVDGDGRHCHAKLVSSDRDGIAQEVEESDARKCGMVCNLFQAYYGK
jgi:hypothetical protein